MVTTGRAHCIHNCVYIYIFCFKWQGSGGLKICPRTNEDHSKHNLELCGNIMANQELQLLYGVYKVNDKGIVTLDKSKVKKHISNIMCSLRKPSAYHKKVSKSHKILFI